MQLGVGCLPITIWPVYTVLKRRAKVRMTTSPLPHEGLGVPQYAWMTSPRGVIVTWSINGN